MNPICSASCSLQPGACLDSPNAFNGLVASASASALYSVGVKFKAPPASCKDKHVTFNLPEESLWPKLRTCVIPAPSWEIALRMCDLEAAQADPQSIVDYHEDMLWRSQDSEIQGVWQAFKLRPMDSLLQQDLRIRCAKLLSFNRMDRAAWIACLKKIVQSSTLQQMYELVLRAEILWPETTEATFLSPALLLRHAHRRALLEVHSADITEASASFLQRLAQCNRTWMLGYPDSLFECLDIPSCAAEKPSKDFLEAFETRCRQQRGTLVDQLSGRQGCWQHIEHLAYELWPAVDMNILPSFVCQKDVDCCKWVQGAVAQLREAEPDWQLAVTLYGQLQSISWARRSEGSLRVPTQLDGEQVLQLISEVLPNDRTLFPVVRAELQWHKLSQERSTEGIDELCRILDVELQVATERLAGGVPASLDCAIACCMLRLIQASWCSAQHPSRQREAWGQVCRTLVALSFERLLEQVEVLSYQFGLLSDRDGQSDFRFSWAGAALWMAVSGVAALTYENTAGTKINQAIEALWISKLIKRWLHDYGDDNQADGADQRPEIGEAALIRRLSLSNLGSLALACRLCHRGGLAWSDLPHWVRQDAIVMRSILRQEASKKNAHEIYQAALAPAAFDRRVLMEAVKQDPQVLAQLPADFPRHGEVLQSIIARFPESLPYLPERLRHCDINDAPSGGSDASVQSLFAYSEI